ncbi:glycosyltransferase [uncultured Bacteroides sp.]|uniref:glycosyltransferase n=1 Tax=uncultured Bacteroides sp. TaxID=162156 RepID=UPI0026072E87|nr:glycosyltransferase [uncultured Bacteroides sp.]
MPKKKVLFLTNSLYGGGAEKVLQTLLSNLNYNLFDVSLCSLKKETLDYKLYPKNLHYNYIFERLEENDKWWKRFRTLVGNKIKLYIYSHYSASLFYKLFIPGQYDIEIAFIEGYATRIISGSDNSKSVKIAWIHIDLSQYRWTNKKGVYKNPSEEIESYKAFNQLIAVSKTVCENMKKLLGVSNILPIYNPIDSTQIINLSQQPTNISPKKDLINIVSVGRLVHQKGYDRLISVIKRLVDNQYKCNLYLIGEGEEKSKLQQLTKSFGMEQSVFFLGYQQNPYNIMEKMDLFVCSSRSEGFSLVIAEAMILGLPIVSTTCSGPNELLDNNKYGILTENSENGLYDGIKSMLDSKELRAQYAQLSLSRSSFFELDKTMNQINSLLTND